jgi:hypothetical protein
MAKFAKRPTDEFDRDLLAQGKKRISYLAEVVARDTGKKDENGEPIFTFGSIYRQAIVDIVAKKPADEPTEGFRPARRSIARKAGSGTKLSQAITMFKEVNGDKDQFLSIAMERLQITKGNAGIYFAKAKERV